MSRYLKEARKSPRDSVPRAAATDLVRLFPQWLRTQANASTPLSDHRPWITLPAMEFLEGYLQPGMTVFEYGSGGSSLFFAERVGRVITVEHDPAWFGRVEDAVRGLKNIDLALVPPVALDTETAARHQAVPGHYLSTDPQFAGRHFEAYVTRIESCADDSLDVVMVDGRARISCFHHAAPKVRPGGLLILDNAEREEYAPAFAQMEKTGWKQRFFFGPGPYIPEFWETTLWQRP